MKDYIHNKGKLEEKEAMQILSQLLNGCNALTQHCIIHRDLKPANILMKGTQPVIIDFGFCEIIQSHKIIRTFNVGSPSYMAP